MIKAPAFGWRFFFCLIESERVQVRKAKKKVNLGLAEVLQQTPPSR
jgi:hypothetical protein